MEQVQTMPAKPGELTGAHPAASADEHERPIARLDRVGQRSDIGRGQHTHDGPLYARRLHRLERVPTDPLVHDGGAEHLAERPVRLVHRGWASRSRASTSPHMASSGEHRKRCPPTSRATELHRALRNLGADRPTAGIGDVGGDVARIVDGSEVHPVSVWLAATRRDNGVLPAQVQRAQTCTYSSLSSGGHSNTSSAWT